MKARVEIDGKKELISTFNGSALAIGRTIAALIENFYDEKSGKIKLPKALHKYLDFTEI
jgi:seryl-tRNA synthetase